MNDAVEDGEYLLGTQLDELRRLGSQHRIWANETHALIRRAGFGTGDRILDLGCGPGLCTVDLAHLVGPSGHVIAVDRSERFLGALRDSVASEGLTNVETRHAEADATDVETASQSGVFMRWVLCYGPDPKQVVREIARVLEPGGTLAILDYFNYEAFDLFPSSPPFRVMVDAVVDSFRATGGDLDVGNHLPALLRPLGFEIRELRPVCRIARPNEPLWAWLTDFFAGYLPRLVETGQLSAEALVAFQAEWATRSEDADAFCFPPPMLELIATKTRDR